MHKDLREWISQAKEMNELAVIEGADPKYEIGTITELDSRNRGPAVLYQKIKGLEPGVSLITNLVPNVRLFNLTFGLPLENSIQQSVSTLGEKTAGWENASENFPPKVVDSAPILENVVEGDDIDLTRFPAPTWHELDGGPYIGTAASVITKDPDDGQINVGTYRGQLLNRRSVGSLIVPGRHGRFHRDKYFVRGEPCPMVMVFGSDPLLFCVSSSEIPRYISEYNYVGAINGEPVPVITGKTTGLPIPANAEIAIEGFVDPKAREIEGPFGEWTGYYGSGSREEPFLTASTLYHRNNPILCGTTPAKGSYSTHSFCLSIWRSALLYHELVKASIPGIKGVWFPQFSARFLQVVAIKQLYDGHATQVGHVAAQSRGAAYGGRYTIVVDDDINPYDIEDVLWAVCTRSQPSDTDLIKKAMSLFGDPMIRKTSENFTTSRAIIYAVKPYSWRDEFPPVALSSEESRKKAFEKWRNTFKGRWQAL